MNLAYFGDLLIYLATACLLSSAGLYLAAWRGKEQYLGLARGFFKIGTVSVVACISILLTLIVTHDFSVAYVFSYSSTDLPLDLLISTLWAGQEGTFLLWVFFTSLLGLIMMRTSGSYERGNMFVLCLFLLSVLLVMIKKSPFEMLPVFRAEGSGLNPLLQNYWMVIHPPIMFAGFSGAVFPFCFAVTALVEKRFKTWGEAARRWTMFAWAALGISLILGGYWAYETLGWGGFWAWDPVENSSLIPWIFLTVQVHALFINRRRNGLYRFSFVAVLMSFWSVLYGTFLTRSGVLADFSVHSFVDLGINQFLVGGLLFFVVLGGSLLLYRWRDIKAEPSFSTVASRSYMVSLGIVILFIGGILVLLGTSAPLITRVMENPSNVGLPYYFSTMTPIATALLALLAFFPLFKWNQGLSRKSLLVVSFSAGIATIILLLLTGVTTRIIYLLMFGMATVAFIPNLFALVSSLRAGSFKAGYLSHIGLILALTGATTSAGLESKETLVLMQDIPISSMGYEVTFTDITNLSSGKENGFDCHVKLVQGADTVHAVLAHEFPKNSEGVMKHPHVENYLWGDIYVSPNSFQPGEETGAGSVTLTTGESTKLDKYEIEFEGFDIGNHGEAAMSATALLSISYDGDSEEVAPMLRLAEGGGVESSKVPFDGNQGSVMIASVIPNEGAVVLQFAGDFIGEAVSTPSILVIELSKKPLIFLFWFGTGLVFLGGILSMLRSSKRHSKHKPRPQLSSPRRPESVVAN